MGFVLTWEREEYVEEEELVRALEETGKALSLDLSVRVVRDGTDEDDEDDEDVRGSSVVWRWSTAVENDVELAIMGAIPIRETFKFTGYGLELCIVRLRSDWEPAYLFVLHVATLLGMAPQHLREYESDYVEEAKGWVEACVGDELDSLEREDSPDVEVESEAGSVGPLEVDVRREAAGRVLEVRGAGTNLRLRLGGWAATWSDAQMVRLVAAVREDSLLGLVDEERALRLATSEPAAAPEFGGKSVFRTWVDGVAQAPRVLGMSDCIGAFGAKEPAGVVCDLVHYLPNGQPISRRAQLEMKFDEPVEELWMVPTWCWAPSSTTAVQRVFEAVTRDVRARFVPPPEPESSDEGLTLRRWLQEFSRISGKLTSLTPRALLRADAEETGLLPAGLRAGSPIELKDVADILAAIESLERSDDDGEAHRGFLLTGEWEDDSTDEFVDELVAMMGLPEAPYSSEPAYCDEYLATLNGAAEALGKKERLYVVPNTIGRTLVVKLLPAVFDELRKAGLLEAHLPEGPAPAQPDLWARMGSWWSKRFS